MKFDQRWWGDLQEFYVANDTRGKYAYWLCNKKWKNNVILCIIVGDEARRVELLSDA